MLNESLITKALESQFKADDALYNTVIERGVRINFDPGVAMNGWIGVYPGIASTAPRTVGSQWKDAVTVQVVVQTCSFDTDAEASDLLEALLGTVTDSMNADLTLGLTGVRIVGFDREYSYVILDDNGGGSLFMPQAVIKVKLEVRSS